MKLTDTVYMPHVWVEFTDAEVDLMMTCAACHYDRACREVGKPGQGSFLYGISGNHQAVRDYNKLLQAGAYPVDLGCLAEAMEPHKTKLHSRDVGLLCKITEQLFCNPVNQDVLQLHGELMKLGAYINSEYLRLNPLSPS